MSAPALALDIGSYSLKVISGKPGINPQVEKALELSNPLGFCVPTDEAQQDKLAQLIETVISDHNLPKKDLRLSLPESVVSTKIISLPWLSDAELASAIGWQAEQHIPIQPEELSLEYQVLYRPERNQKDQNMRVLLIGVRKAIVERFMGVFAKLGLEPTLLETQTLSILRSLQFTQDDPTTLLVHLGENSMNLAVVALGELSFVFTHLSGGQLLTRALEQTIGLDHNQAEEYKKTYGLDESQFQGKVRSALLPALSILVSEIQKAIRFTASQNPTAPIQRILLSGGSSSLPGLVGYLAQELNTEVLVAAPFNVARGEVSQVNAPAFVVSMGLLMREL